MAGLVSFSWFTAGIVFRITVHLQTFLVRNSSLFFFIAILCLQQTRVGNDSPYPVDEIAENFELIKKYRIKNTIGRKSRDIKQTVVLRYLYRSWPEGLMFWLHITLESWRMWFAILLADSRQVYFRRLQSRGRTERILFYQPYQHPQLRFTHDRTRRRSSVNQLLCCQVVRNQPLTRRGAE